MLKFEQDGTLSGGEKSYRLVIDGETIAEGLSLDQVIEAFNRRTEEKLCRFADALDVSLDYLFMRSERPERAEEIIGDGRATARVAPTDDKPTWFEGEPENEGRYFARIDMGDERVHEAVGEFRGGSWSVFGGPLHESMKVVGWWPLPERE